MTRRSRGRRVIILATTITRTGMIIRATSLQKIMVVLTTFLAGMIVRMQIVGLVALAGADAAFVEGLAKLQRAAPKGAVSHWAS